jgi:heterodisulfide reductase subunit B
LPARNLALAEQQGLTTLLVPCSACYSRMLTAADTLRRDDRRAREVNAVLDPLRYLGTVQVKNILEVLWGEVGPDAILRAKRRDLQGLRLACYYGCYLTRTPGVPSFDDREHPQSLERLVRLLGAAPVDWPYQTDCCGAGFALIESSWSVRLCEKLYAAAYQRGAEALVTTCPLCQTNLDLNQDRIRDGNGLPGYLPVFYVTDLLALTTGRDLGRRQWRRHFIDPRDLLRRYALVGQRKQE